jgi:iron complex outermembrane receptor protein
MALTNRENDFSFNEALRYAALYNPTAPIRFANGEYFQAILFDNFNPVAIINQNVNKGKTKTLNYSAKADYSLTKNLTFTLNYGRQFGNDFNGSYYSRNSLFRGFNRGGLARRATNDRDFSLLEMYGNYSNSFGKLNLDFTAGYSYQEENSSGTFIEMGNFPNDQLGYNAIQQSADRVTNNPDNINISSYGNPAQKIIAQFARLSLTYDNGLFFNASVRREGSTKLGVNNRIGIFPAFGAGVDLNKYLNLNVAKVLKFRVGYGVTGSLPGSAGLSRDRYDYSFTGGGTMKIGLNGNPDLKWEQKAETNVGVDFAFGKFSGTLDAYQRDIKDFILERDVDVTKYASGRRTENAGSLRTRGIELALNYNALEFGELRWTPGINVTSYKTTLESFIIPQQMQAEVGAPGQNGSYMVKVKVGQPVGQIWGPVFDHVSVGGSDGANQVQDPNDATKGVAAGGVVFKDLNGNGLIDANAGQALDADGDFKVLGTGIPKMELGWTNQLTYKNWDLNAFFRGAFGHSLVNSFRTFYEPIDPGAIKSYNRVTTDKAVSGLTEAKFSSLYVEKASFIKLDNVTLGYNIKIGESKAFKSVRLYGTAQNVFQITNYTGIDPDPVLVDYGSSDNGGFQGTTPNPLAPGIDRRNNYFTARTFTFGVTVNFK